MIKKLFLLSTVFSSIVCNGQNNNRGFGLGFDLTMHNESNKYYNDLNTQPSDTIFSEISHVRMFDCFLNLTYAITGNSVIGIFVGIGSGKKEKHFGNFNSIEELRAGSVELGLLYKNYIRITKKLKAYIEPNIGYRSTDLNGSGYRYQAQGPSNAERYDTKIKSIVLNVKAGINYSLTKKISIEGFVSNNLITMDKYVVGSAWNIGYYKQEKNNWTFINRYLIFGAGVHYKFRA